MCIRNVLHRAGRARLASTGQNQAMSILTPTLGINYVIALQGTYPSERRATREVQNLDPFVGQIMMFGGNFAPRGWAFCDGQLLAVADNDALFSLLGTIYGGDGETTFALPDLRGRVSKGPGNGPALANVQIGEKSGAENVFMTSVKMAPHTHDVPSSDVNPL
eukprot:TRINITY_DN355_c0_g5_i3.p1 TRINITY_DN355_c0_g5~~TRINITY_DN355_c0_g5_i3.p1  ORF type:complete len:163 (+),score=4.03 TRINITY_DN355_c0_g5_i3:353-841(+)